MNVKGFAINGGPHPGMEEIAVFDYSMRHRIPHKRYMASFEVPEGYIPVGNVEWVEKFLPKEKTVPDYYPEFLTPYLYRKVWRADTWPLGQKVFIKPSDRHKRFDGRFTTGTYKGRKRPPYWCSEVVQFDNEWRYYVADGVVLTGEWYDGPDQENTPDAPTLSIPIPDGYCGALDFGMLKTGELALVEANSPYACGWYGKDHKLYVEWLIKGWAYLNRASNSLLIHPLGS